MRIITTRVWLLAMLLGLLGVSFALVQTVKAQCIPEREGEFCSATHRLLGNLSSISPESSPAANTATIEKSLLPPAGGLIYSDLKKLEAEARALLIKSRTFRRNISPHLEKPDFDELVATFDEASDFNQKLPSDPNGPTLQERIDQADSDLRRARDLYAFLAVYADAARFRSDATLQWGNAAEQQPGRTGLAVCQATPHEDDLVGVAPAYLPTYDYCNFADRMRESVREAAYLRMIFGQQFTASALGLNFGGEVVGGEVFVRREVGQLQLAADQYEGALAFVKDGMRRDWLRLLYLRFLRTARVGAALARLTDASGHCTLWPRAKAIWTTLAKPMPSKITAKLPSSSG
ncbi:MAG: hypothetical protein R2932_26640 [Caldilineaceae bacterium]